ncbi:LPS assembly protein LptD [Psychrobacter sanguinis]|uniref:LPS-assembly protein LptD n=1 Tax=Psychrobacter sanguinis TaxID=861445 RepID=A0A844M0K7_9GAMM|nr:LPS assembly protein LptD [Psychrobacter sanguinis]MUG32285.1 LPS assembly protein LptD [Psychrobacter sanguinis]
MLYSQLYSSILRACRDFSRRPHTTTRLAFSLPLLISVPSAYGAIISPQAQPDSSVQSVKAVPTASVSQASTFVEVATLTDASTKTYKRLDTKTDTTTGTAANKQTSAAVRPTTVNKAVTEASVDLPAAPLTAAANSASTEALQAVGLESEPQPAFFNKAPLTNKDFVAKQAKANQTKANQARVTQSASASIAKVNSSEDDYIQVKSADDGLPTATNNSAPKTNPVPQANADLRAPTVPSTPAGATPNSAKQSSGQAAINKNKQASSIGKRVDESKNLAASFKDDSVQKSLERLAQFYQLQAEELRERVEQGQSGSVIEAQAMAPVAAPQIFNSQSDGASAYRCEGVWVTPSSAGADANYQQAIQRSQQQDGLSLANGLPLYAQSDYAYYDNTTYVELAGNVEVMQDGKMVSADQIALDLNTGIAGAKGGVLLAESGPSNPKNQPTSLEKLATNQDANATDGSGMIVVADELAYNTNNSAATAYDVAFASVPMQAHGYAKRLNKPDNTHYELEKVMFSTCPPANRKWQIEAQNIDINTETGRGEAYNATFRLGKVPVLYLPYFNFPVDDRRSSGVLTPNARIDSDSGLKLSVPYYLNLAPNYDATVTTDIYSNRNPMLTGEFRYLTEDYGQGQLTTAYMPKDKKYDDEDRTGVFYQHQWASKTIPRLTADAVYSYVSDPDYLNDFDDYGLVENRLNLPRRGRVNYYDDYINAQLKVETFQSLEATDVNGNIIQDKDKPYSRLPQLTVDYRLPTLNNALDKFVITGVHDSAYFKKSIDDGSENEKSGVRVYNEINASYPIEKTWGYVTPKVSLQHLYAAFDEESRLENNVSKDDNDQSAFVPKFSIDSGLNFYQAGSPFGWFDNTMGGYQLLTPRVKYSYSPFEDQSAIPNFDTRFASIDYDQLFADSWFLGHDRISDNNNVAVGLNYRYIDSMGITRFDGGIGDQFFLSKPKVLLDSEDAGYDSHSTGVAWRSSVQPYRNLWFDFNGALDSNNNLNYIASQVRYNPTPNSLVNFGVIERKEDRLTNQSELSALTAAAIVPINDSWRVLGQGQYDSRNNKFIDATLGLDYEDCCYGFSIYGRSYYNDLNLDDKPTRAIMAEFRINGFGDRSSRLSKHLNDKILGYEPVDTLWKK